MMISFAFFAVILAFAAYKAEDGFARWFLVFAACLNLLGLVVMFTSGDEAKFYRFERAWTQGDRRYFSD
jgi:hypothetical protein